MIPLILLIAPLARSTPAYDPSTPLSTCTGEQASTHDGTIPLWAAIERHEDPGAGIFVQEDFNEVTAWPENAAWAPWIGECFGDTTPRSSAFLLHLGPRESISVGTPILFVPGAGDNGSRGFIAMATRMNNAGRPVYSLTFAHPHGDVFQQAEIVADAIARIQARTGAEQVDVVAHSKGGLAAAVYASNHETAAWERSDYAGNGTRYRGDIRRLVLIAAPLGGVDTSYRWPSANYLSLDADTAMAPVSWRTYYPYGSATWTISTDLSAQDLMPGEPDLFPGQRQLLARWDDVFPLPGESATLGLYALQQDWYTTYEGGYGYLSYSDGIDAAIEAGDDLLPSLEANGVDPGIEIFLLAGENPLMHNGAEYLLMDGLVIDDASGVTQAFAEAWLELADAGVDTYAELVASLVDDALVDVGIAEDEVQGLVQGKLVLGEVSGPSDGVVFVESATRARTLTGRGADVVETRVVNLSHLDLLYASPITGQILIDAGNADPTENAWQRAVGERYLEADTLGWVQEILADEPGGSEGGDDGGDDGADGGADGGDGGGDGGGSDDTGLDSDDDGAGGDGGGDLREDSRGRDAGGCAVAPTGGGLLGLLLPMLALLRRRPQ